MLEARAITKRFPGVLALDRVDLSLSGGEVVALIGENGAGKSTLMRILAGVEQPDRGEVHLEGRAVVIDSPKRAAELGIALLHQELALAENLDLAANVFLGREPVRGGPLRLIDRRRLEAEAASLLEKAGLPLPPTTPLRRLSIAERQLVEIAKALSLEARYLILDEPTSSLSGPESERLFQVIGELKQQGVGILYITHRMPEVERLADRVLALRDGRNSGELPRAEASRDALVRLMVGRDVEQFYRRREHPVAAAPLLAVRGLRWPGARHAVDLEVRPGEVLGLAGLVGAGRTALAETLFGIRPAAAGTVRISGEPFTPRSPAEAIAAGLVLVPEDRKAQGLVLELAIDENLTLPGLARWHRRGFLPAKELRERAAEQARRLDVRAADLRRPALELSGGNQQKVVLGKWLALEPRVLVLDEPTRGVDVVAKQEIYVLVQELAARGMGILMISSELQEILGIADRVLVMHEGRVTGELQQDELSEEAVMHLATGAA